MLVTMTMTKNTIPNRPFPCRARHWTHVYPGGARPVCALDGTIAIITESNIRKKMAAADEIMAAHRWAQGARP